MSYLTPPTTEADLRKAGFTAEAFKYPLSELAARWLAEFNGVAFEAMPAAWHYAPNEYMQRYLDRRAA